MNSLPSDLLQPPGFVKLLSHELRWTIVKALSLSDFRVLELVEMIGQPMNLVSYHLKHLREEQLVISRRSDADGRDVYYSLNLPQLQALYHATGAALNLLPVSDTGVQLDTAQIRVLFLCTGNSARSQMAEGFLRVCAGERVSVCSAGSEPKAVHPLAVRVMAERGINISKQVSKQLDTYDPDDFDYVITVCDRVREVCPPFPGITMHWSIPDPAAHGEGVDAEAVFQQTAEQIAERVNRFNQIILQNAAQN